MKIKILGTRGEIEPSTAYHSKHSGVLVDQKIMLDLGEPEFLKYNPKYIFITHLHPDHAFFVTDQEAKIKPPVYAPEKYKNKIQVKMLSKSGKFNGYQIRPIPTIHSKKVKSQAYLIEKGHQRLLYTGDMIWIKKEYHNLLKNLDLVITEASFFRKGGMVRRDKETGEIFGHTGVPDLIKLFKKFSKNILLIHFGSWFYQGASKSRKKIKKLAKEHQVNLIVGYDGLTLDLKQLTT